MPRKSVSKFFQQIIDKDPTYRGLTIDHSWDGDAEHHVCCIDETGNKLTVVIDPDTSKCVLDYSGWQA